MTNLTRTEYGAYRMQLDEKKCKACRHLAFSLWGNDVCKKGKRWPTFGKCKYFDDKGSE